MMNKKKVVAFAFVFKTTLKDNCTVNIFFVSLKSYIIISGTTLYLDITLDISDTSNDIRRFIYESD